MNVIERIQMLKKILKEAEKLVIWQETIYTTLHNIDASWVVSGVFPVVRGGTGLSTIAAGGILYASALDILSRLAPTAANQVLRSTAANALQFAALLAADIPNLPASKITSGVFGLARIPNIDWARIAANFPRTIAELLSDHDKAAHDALDIDADTVDGDHKADLEGTMDSKIATHKGLPSAHHAKYTDAEAIAAAKTDSALLNPSGGIISWSGLIANIPSGWIICDGNNGTPNLLGRFVESVPTAATDPGATGGATAKTTAGHVHTTPAHTLTEAEMPAHAHSYYITGPNPGVTDGLSYSTCNASNQDNIEDTLPTSSKGGGGSHAHGNTGSKTDSIADIRPKYYDGAFLMKT